MHNDIISNWTSIPYAHGKQNFYMFAAHNNEPHVYMHEVNLTTQSNVHDLNFTHRSLMSSTFQIHSNIGL